MEEADRLWTSGGGRLSRCVAVVAALGLLLLSAVGGARPVESGMVAARADDPVVATPVAFTSAVEATATSPPTPTAVPRPPPLPEPTAAPELAVPATIDSKEAVAPSPEDAAAFATARPDDGAATADVATGVDAVVALRVETANVSFGEVTGTGEIDPSATGVTSRVAADGAFYIIADAIRLTVTSNVPWTGACFAAENVGTAATVRVAAGRLAWRLSGATEWTAFAVASPDGRACFPVGKAGVTTFRFDLRLRVERADLPGTFVSAISFAVAPAAAR